MFALHELSNKISSSRLIHPQNIANNLLSHPMRLPQTIAFENDDNDYDVCVDYKAGIIIICKHVRL